MASSGPEQPSLDLIARHEALFDIADVICTYRDGQSLMHHLAARLQKHKRNKKLNQTTPNRDDGFYSTARCPIPNHTYETHCLMHKTSLRKKEEVQRKNYPANISAQPPIGG